MILLINTVSREFISSNLSLLSFWDRLEDVMISSDSTEWQCNIAAIIDSNGNIYEIDFEEIEDSLDNFDILYFIISSYPSYFTFPPSRSLPSLITSFLSNSFLSNTPNYITNSSYLSILITPAFNSRISAAFPLNN